MRSVLNSIFSYAFCENMITDNPYSRVDFKKYSDMLTESTSVEERFHSDEDIERILEHIHAWQKKKPYYIPAYALEMQIICGMRRGELPPLKWSDITEKYIFIHQQQLTVKKLDGVPEHFEIVSHTKNYKNRKYPITDEVLELIGRLKTVHEKYYSKSEFVFPANSENGCITNNTIYDYYRRVCKKLDITVDKNVIKGTHAFRRTKITQVINNSNGNVILASQLFGNSPEVAKKNYYTGLNLELAKEVLCR